MLSHLWLLRLYSNVNFCSTFGDIFDVRHFIDSLRDEIHIIKRLPKKFNRKTGGLLVMPPVSWSSEKYYLQQVR